MDVSDILNSLNDEQRAAVTAPEGNVLVLAGAGSGKTRVLVHRIAWLVRTAGVSPYGILAVTFTNKAAAEMRGRIESLLGMPAGGMWVGTFHGLAHRLLRAHWQEAGLPQGFQILDSDDQQRLIRRIQKELELDEAKWPPKQAQWFINNAKDDGLRPQHLDDQGDPVRKQLIRIYAAYEERCATAGLVDFAELLLRAHELWLQRPDLLAHYRQRFRHILVDEFQDTNAIQYAWLRMLAGERGHVFIVGDDDQSIYGWRGARVENIHRFRDDFADTRLVRLEQNYRSTGNILAAANQLIGYNSDRLGKRLWTTDGEGEPILLYGAFNDLDEARFVVERVQQWIDEGGRRSECAVLYRSNAQSRVIEESLVMAGIPYRVYGGLRFFERAEVKDALAYLRLIANSADDAAFERVVNVPARGIGDRTVQAVRDAARLRGISLWEAAAALLQERVLTARAASAVAGFVELVERLSRDTQDLALDEQMEHVQLHSGLVDHYRKEGGEKGRARVENLEELVNAARQFEPDEEQEGMAPLTAFLAYAVLEAGEGQGGAGDDCVQMMTLHSAKGLEFPLVFMVGMEEGLFPHELSAGEPGRMEEERRLCYVGITRARQQLYLCWAEKRRLYGRDAYAMPSRFISEMPREVLRDIRPQASVTLPRSSPDTWQVRDEAFDGFRVGQRVVHAKFGEGVLLGYEGSGASARVQVNFEAEGLKWLVLAYANLQAL